MFFLSPTFVAPAPAAPAAPHGDTRLTIYIRIDPRLITYITAGEKYKKNARTPRALPISCLPDWLPACPPSLSACRSDQVTLRLLRGAGDPVSGALVFAGQPRSTAALAFALDPSALATPVRPEAGATMEALADGLDEVWTIHG